MAMPRHLIDDNAHGELFESLRRNMLDSLEEVRTALTGSLFIPGMIMPFSGQLGGSDGKRPLNPHTGTANEAFALCDGGTYQAPGGPLITTPDLRNRFVIASGGAYAPGSAGGAASHGHGISLGATTLAEWQMPHHGHQQMATSGNTLVGLARFTGVNYGAPFHALESTYRSSSNTTSTPLMTSYTGGNGAHGHAISLAAAASLPPYYALAYIMKL